jgi:integrase/recombinase XerC
MTTYLGGRRRLRTRQAEARRVPRLAGRARAAGLARSSTARAFSRCAPSSASSTSAAGAQCQHRAIQTPKLPRSVPKALSERDMDELLETPAGWSASPGSICATRRAAAALRRGPAHRRGAGPAKGTSRLLKAGRTRSASPARATRRGWCRCCRRPWRRWPPIATPAPTWPPWARRAFFSARAAAARSRIVQKRVREIRGLLGLPTA